MTSRKDTSRNWVDFWKRLEKKVGEKSPPFTEALISWLFRKIHGDKVYESLAGWKRKGNRKPENDRLAIGIRSKKSEERFSGVAFSLFPAKRGRLLFILHAVDAQKAGETMDEADLRRWLGKWNLPLILFDCIFPGRRPIGREGDLGLNHPCDRYAKIEVLGFDGKDFTLARKTPVGVPRRNETIRVPGHDVLNLLLFEITHRARRERGSEA